MEQKAKHMNLCNRDRSDSVVVQFQVVAVSSRGLSRERGGHWPLLPAWFEVKWARLEGKKAVNWAKEVNKAGTRGELQVAPSLICKSRGSHLNETSASSVAAGHMSFKGWKR